MYREFVNSLVPTEGKLLAKGKRRTEKIQKGQTHRRKAGKGGVENVGQKNFPVGRKR